MYEKTKSSVQSDNTISVGSNKSILGLSGAVVSNTHRDFTAGAFQLMGSDNIIIRNLTILGPGAYDIDANNSDTTLSQGNRVQFVPQYQYISYDADKVVSVVTDSKTGAGPTLKW